eukprot:3386482-Pleurochrysis_carterae.AAC.4
MAMAVWQGDRRMNKEGTVSALWRNRRKTERNRVLHRAPEGEHKRVGESERESERARARTRACV